jgi:hypothetical protein
VSAAQQIIQHAREAGLPADLAQELEQRLVPDLEEFLARVPALPPGGEEETALIVGLLDLYRPNWPLLARALGALSDGASKASEDLQAPDLQEDPARSRALRPLADALDALVRLGTMAATLVARHDPTEIDFPDEVDVESMPDDLRTYMRGLLALLVGLDRVRGDLDKLAPWAWLARRDLVKSEALILVALQQADSAASRPPRKPGGWRGRVWISEDFDAPLPDFAEFQRELERRPWLAQLVETGEVRPGRRGAVRRPGATGVDISSDRVDAVLDELRGDPG